MDDAERRRWRRNARKAEALLLSLIEDRDSPVQHRLKAAELTLDRYYGKATAPQAGEAPTGPQSLVVDFGEYADYAE